MVLYLIRSGAVGPDGVGRYKIGKTKDIGKRVRDLATGNPDPLVVVKVWTLPDNVPDSGFETLVHATFEARGARLRTSAATEFFELRGPELAEAATIAIIDRLETEYVAQWRDQHAVQALPQTTDDRCAGDAVVAGLIRERRRLRAAIAVQTARLDTLDARIKQHIGHHAGIDVDGRPAASWATQTSARFDEGAFSDDNPELYRQYKRRRTNRVFRVNP